MRTSQILLKSLNLPTVVQEPAFESNGAASRIERRAVEFLEQVWNHGNYNVIDTHLTQEFRFHHEAGIVSNRTEMKKRIQQFRTSFCDFSFQVSSTCNFGTFIVCKWQVQMTHSGHWIDLAPTGKRVRVIGASWVHVVDDLFGDAWDFWNPRLLYAQLSRNEGSSIS